MYKNDSYFELRMKIWKWKWSCQLNKQPKRLIKNLKKIQAWPGIERPDLSDDRTQLSMLQANQANWRASHYEFVIYPMVEMT